MAPRCFTEGPTAKADGEILDHHRFVVELPSSTIKAPHAIRRHDSHCIRKAEFPTSPAQSAAVAVGIRTTGRLFPLAEESARFALSGGRATCVFDIAPDLWTCNFDPNQIGQVIDNLVINAQQAMPGAGTVRISARNASLQQNEAAALPAGNYVIVSVEDSGTGIPAETLPRIFDPFFTTRYP